MSATPRACWTACLLGLSSLLSWEHASGAEDPVRETIQEENLERWRIKAGVWSLRQGEAAATGGVSFLIRGGEPLRDVEIEADVSYRYDQPHAAAGLAFRLDEDMTGYVIALREIEKGVHPVHGPWERPVLQLWRLDRDGWKLLQESKVEGCRSGLPRRLKASARGPEIRVYYQDMVTPVLKEFDDQYDRPGALGLWKDHVGESSHGHVRIRSPDATASPLARIGWSSVRGAVYVRSDAVNSVQMWHEYWNRTDVLDRELSYAALYGFNMVQVYLHWIVWDRHREEYLRRIDDFLTRASRAGLKTSLILWDDCGHVEPSLTFDDPIPGRHNAQMMPNPSHRIRDDAAALLAHEEPFREYVQGIARFQNDDRIAFWQLYNEAMGPKENYRDGTGDANVNRLLGWTRAWLKEAGAYAPVTATGGGFYGPKYSDFYTYHSYADATHPLPNTDGGPEHLCTETLNRPACGLSRCVRDFAEKRNGFVIWELMIGRDNCRFPWGHPDGPDEPAAPFHGVVYPDGHPWDVEEVRTLLGDAAFAALQGRVFRVEYFVGSFQARKKASITPRVDFDLGDETGTGSPDASAGIGKDDFSVRWTGLLRASNTGTFSFEGDSDGVLRLWLDDALVLDKQRPGRHVATGAHALTAGCSYTVKIEYVHREGPAAAHLFWSGPGLEKRILRLDDVDSPREPREKSPRAESN